MSESLATWEARMAARSQLREAERRRARRLPDEPNPSRDEVLASLAPGVDADHCSHGIAYGRGGLPEGVGWAGGVAFCECCRSHYGYIDTGWAWMGGTDGPGGGGHSTDKHLCRECGGRIRAWGDPFGE